MGVAQVIDFIRVFPLYYSTPSRYNSLMKCEIELKVGDVVKSLDFVGVNDCYYVGLVMGVSKMDGTFRAKTIKRVWQGEVDYKKIYNDFFVAPLPGNHLLDDLEENICDPRIQVVA